MLITAKQVEEAMAAGRAAVEVRPGDIVTPAARDRARELGIAVGGGSNGNGAYAPPPPQPASGTMPAAPAATRVEMPPPAQQRLTPTGRPAQHEIDIKPNYFESPVIDNLFTIVLELGAALWVVKDRLRVIEEFLNQAGVVTTEQIEMYRPGPDKQKELVEARNAFIERIYGIIKENPG